MSPKEEKVIPGVRCDVSNCVYHDGNVTCTAGSINVGPGKARRKEETACNTFERKDI
jgi:hypothetical protein